MLENLLVEKHLSARLLLQWALFSHDITQSTWSLHCFGCGFESECTSMSIQLGCLGYQGCKGKDGSCPPQHQFLTQNIHEGLGRTETELQKSLQKLIEFKNAEEYA